MKTSNVARYQFRRLSPAEFMALRRAASVSVRDFMYLTGRHSHLVAQYHGETDKSDQRPSMGDVLILEILRRRPDLYDAMMDICDEYSLGAQPERKTK